MNRYKNLQQKLLSGSLAKIDGGTGTEVERRGVPQLDGAWNGGAALSHPDILRQVHKDYINAGAEIIIANTFACHRHALRDANQEQNFEAYNQRGVEIANQARADLDADSVLIAGGVSYWSWTDNHPSLGELSQSAGQQAEVMKQAGADLIMLEMMIDIERMLALIDGIQDIGLPIWVGFTSGRTDQKIANTSQPPALRNGDLLKDAIASIQDREVDAINMMHTDVCLIDHCMETIRTHWQKPFGVYAHSGGYRENKWLFDGVISEEDYAGATKRWIHNGAQIIGGCCGITPSHIAHIECHA